MLRLMIGSAVVLAVTAGTATNAAPGQPGSLLSAEEKAAGWKMLFDGRSLTGWKGYKTDTVPTGWTVADSVLTRSGPGGDLMTAEQYGDFEMRFEWRVPQNGNSGIIYRIAETEQYPWQTGPEYQVLHNQGHADGKNPITSAGSNYAVNPPVKDVTKPLGEWNEGRLIVQGNHVEHWLNGVKVVDYEIGSADWEARVKASKFAKVANYGRMKRGFIALQDHGDAVSYRNLKIRPL